MKLVFLLACLSLTGFARERFWAFAELGNQSTTVLSYQSSPNTPLQASYPLATWTVYLGGSEAVATGQFTSAGSATITGSTGQTITLTFLGGTGGTATATLTSTNTVAPGSTLIINTGGSGFAGPPTQATCSSGTASCSGTVIVTTTVTGTLASIYSDNAGTPLANPFTVTGNGYGYFYADCGRYDVVESSGTPQAFPQAFTLGDVTLFDPTGLTAHGVLMGGGVSGCPVASAAGTLGQAFVSGGPASNGAYGPLNLAGGSNIFVGVLPIANGGTGTATPGLIAGSGIGITGTWPDNTIAATYLAPGTGASTVNTTNQLTGIAVLATDYGVVADGVMSQGAGPGYIGTISGTDNCTAITNALAALGTNGITKLIWPPGLIVTACAMTLGNGSSSAWSTIKSVTMEGAGGYNPAGSASIAGVPAGYPYGQYTAYQGGTMFAYNGPPLGTTPFFTLQGPIQDVHLKGMGFNCRYLCETGAYLTSFEGSDVIDILVFDTLASTNIYNAAFWVDADSSATAPGYGGTQFDRVIKCGSISQVLNVQKTDIMIGCGNISLCAGGLDVSGVEFSELIVANYAGIGHGIVVGYADSNVFNYSPIGSSYQPWYIQELSNGFPGTNPVYAGVLISGNAFMTSWTLTQDISASYGSGSATFTTTAGIDSNTPLVGSFIQIGSEIMPITGVSGTIPTAMTITVNRGRAAGIYGQVIVAHSSGDPIQGPNGYAIDGNGACVSTSSDTLYFSGGNSFAGLPVGSRIDSQASPNTCNVSGVTTNGYKFDSPGSLTTASNPFAFSLAFQTASIGNSTGPLYFSSLLSSYAVEVPPGFVTASSGVNIGQGANLHITGRLIATNTTGSAASAYGAIKFTTNSGSTVAEAPSGIGGVPEIGTGTTASIDFDITVKVGYINPSFPYAGNLLIMGEWRYAGTTGAVFPFVISSSAANQDLSDGITIDLGCAFSTASSSLTAYMQDLNVQVNNPNFSGLR